MVDRTDSLKSELTTVEKQPINEKTADVKQRGFFGRFWHGKPPPPPTGDTENAAPIPEVTASWLSLLLFQWITPIMTLGYARPLEASDLWKLQDDRMSAYTASRILDSFDRRRAAADDYNKRLAAGDVQPPLHKRVWWSVRGQRKVKEQHWRDVDGKRQASLALALNDAVFWWFWSGGILKVIGDTAQVTSPLLVKAIIQFATDSYSAYMAGHKETAPPIGKGVGLAIGLFALQAVTSFCTHHFFYRAASTGVLLRGGLITAIYSRSLKLTNKARGTLTNGKLVNHISTDVSRIDFCAGFFHMSWSAPIQLGICLALLIINLGPSALAGFALFFICSPAQTFTMKLLFKLRKKSMLWTDKRAKLLQELLGGIKVIKVFNWEVPFLRRIEEFRKREMGYIRSLLISRSANNAVAMSLPILASVLAFVTYALTGHAMDPSVIFASLTLFTLLRMPLMMLPMSLSTIADASNAVNRLTDVFNADTFGETQIHDHEISEALLVEKASFSWDSPPQEEETKVKKPKKGKDAPVPAVKAALSEKEEMIFQVKDITMSIPRGQLAAVVGSTGSGKTSLIQGLVGEMRKTEGTVVWGGSIAYCPQSAWIQNATIRENICFGRAYEEKKYWAAVHDACLEPDLDMLPNGDHTEVGEKGISLSGGQKQRLNICRAIYCDADITIFDDPFSALDAHVGKAVFQNVLMSGRAGKTRILVTHALHFLPQVDYIYTVSNGRIVERGTYPELMGNNGDFSRFVNEFGTQAEEKEMEEEEGIEEGAEGAAKGGEVAVTKPKKRVAGPGMMQEEERRTGAVSGKIYGEYAKAGRGYVVIPLLAASLVLMQGSQVMASYWLVWWQEDSFNQAPAFYMGVYAGLGVAQAVTVFLMGCCFAMLTYFSSQRLHKWAIQSVLHAPMSFFETTPLGRIMNRFSKDVDTIDNTLGESVRMFATTFSGILGAIILIAIVLPWFLIAVAAVMVVYLYAATYYRASARELKRLDNVLRSSVYAHFSESLSGLATIRAYGEADRFKADNEKRVNMENRAYWLTVTNQRWLGIRLDAMGATLTFVVAMLAVGTRFSISPSQTGVVLSYILSVQQAFGWLIRQWAEAENDMSSVERLIHYAQEIEQEPAHEMPDKKPPAPWPSKGEIEINNIVMQYRPELPPVIKGVTMKVADGEKIGIVGRTGAGKSSIMTALFRLVELTSGSIVIDGVDISTVGLSDLRSGISIIPQDPLLFSGTLRSNLDPFGLHDDARLWDALKRSYLVESPKLDTEDNGPEGSQTPVNRFSLDSTVEDEGNNLSIGQRSLVSLARALVKDTNILVLDEATASVDYETDRNIQDTIAREFKDRTILCIAHRLKTIIGYDRICVLDAGQISEFDTPAALFQNEDGIFRSMCERSSITLDDIKMAAKGRMQDEDS
ncbi:P-loop containing nucleoside triphosphate hydrolase protein [Schizophyllum amplum]|uniref:P-loop containing nucleoside triphosphate hydrolase protein n=1 Tax=Schizophyllum amplum TaxID=97359 RepID=A0A550CHH0_9AGAR|nr:P-loop containing nucleoside triphosphate hydrolase protein [Auriculariopsis ampla]